MNQKLKEIEVKILESKLAITDLTISAINALNSREYSFASSKVHEILDMEESLAELNASYENEQENERYS